MSNLQYALTQAHLVASTSTGYSMGDKIVGVVVVLIALISMWKIYTKAGRPGWAAIIPIYGTYVQLQIIKRPWWWLLLLLIPFVNIVVIILIMRDLARAFGKGVGYTLLLLFIPVIGYPLLAWGDATYQPAALGR